MSDLVGNPEDRFSRVAAHTIHTLTTLSYLLIEIYTRFILAVTEVRKIFYLFHLCR